MIIHPHTEQGRMNDADLLAWVNLHLSYDRTTGHFTWIKAPKMHPRMQNKKAGSTRDGYVKIKVQGIAYSAHRLAWLITYGTMPELIDHKNRMPSDNRLVNLRIATRLNNSQNHSPLRKSSPWPAGVRQSKSGKFVARIRNNKVPVHLGSFDTPDMAASAYNNAQKIFFGEFAP